MPTSDPLDSPAETMPVTDDVGAAFTAYCQMRSELVANSRPIELTAGRRAKLASRLHEIGGLAEWNDILGQIRVSPFLRGEKSRDGRFVAQIDWLLEPRNIMKIKEGNFDDRPAPNQNGARPRSRSGSPASAIFAARNRIFGDRQAG